MGGQPFVDGVLARLLFGATSFLIFELLLQKDGVFGQLQDPFEGFV